MTDNMSIFEQVAARKLTPEQGALLLMKADRDRKAARRPAWMPLVAWAVLVTLASFMLACIGIKND